MNDQQFIQLQNQSIRLLHTRIPELMLFADHLPSGRRDEKAQVKLCAELMEFLQALIERDRLGAFTELADMVYYAAKVLSNQLMPEYQVATLIASACAVLDCSVLDAFDVAQIKYRLRAEINCDKDDSDERKQIAYRMKIHLSPNVH